MEKEIYYKTNPTHKKWGIFCLVAPCGCLALVLIGFVVAGVLIANLARQ